MAIAAILAGGAGRRFGGRDKSALPVGDRTILERQLRAVSGAVDGVLIVGQPPGRRVPDGAVAVPDRIAGAGPLAGLDASLTAAKGEDVLLIACDMPNLTTAFLRHLVAQSSGSIWNAVVPRTDRGYHPLCAVYSVSSHDAVQRRLAAGQLRMIDLVRELRVRVVTGAELARFGDAAHLLANVNTPADLAALDALQNH